MKEQTYFHIPTPCHENWNNMTPEGKGRFCASCSKQVVDFSLMSDQQVLNYFKNTTGKVCGRFADDQLQRPMIAAAEQKKKVWWVAAMMPVLMLFGKANAQKKKGKVTQGEPAMIIPNNRPEIMGKIAIGTPIPELIIKKIIKGSVKDENGNSIPYANIRVPDFRTYIQADSSGNFEFEILSQGKDSVTIAASCIGYESIEQNIVINNLVAVTLKQKEIKLPDVAVSCALTGKVGGAYSVRAITIHEKIDTVVRKLMHNEEFKIFPNPVAKGNSVKLEIKKPGEYSIQLLDNNSKLILIKDITTVNEKSITEIAIPSSLAAGIYYIRLIDEKKKKQYTDKLIVQ